jgi:hypothetical protein
VGGGPSGVEFSAELHDFLKDDAPALFPNLPIDMMKISLFDVLPHVLGMFDAKLVVSVATFTVSRLPHHPALPPRPPSPLLPLLPANGGTATSFTELVYVCACACACARVRARMHMLARVRVLARAPVCSLQCRSAHVLLIPI